MKIDIVFLIILGFMVLRTICNNKTNTKEHMAVTDDIKAAIKELYTVDVSAIQNLSSIATKLQEGGLTIAGDLKITGATIVGGALKVKDRDILAELDALNNKTKFITTDVDKTIFKGFVKIPLGIYMDNQGRIYFGDMALFRDAPLSVWGGPAGSGRIIQTQ